MKKKIIAIAATLLVLIPAWAVLNEKNLSQTLSVLRYELGNAYRTNEAFTSRMRSRGNMQHARLVSMMQKSNELSLMLYSQKQDYTFDMTYALNEVSKQYEEFSSRKMPFDDIINRLDVDIDRYDRLVHTLRSLPPSQVVEYIDSLGNVVYVDAKVTPRMSARKDNADRLSRFPRAESFTLDSIGRIDRDSCLFFATALLNNSREQKEALIRDSVNYAETAHMLKSAYDYAQKRYKNVQNKIFIEGQTGYLTLLKSFRRYWRQASSDATDKYSLKSMGNVHSQWRGPIVVGFSLFVLFYLLVSNIVAIFLVRILTSKVKFFKRERFAGHKFEMTALTAVIIFALSIWIASAISTQHFFSMAAHILVEFVWMLAAILVSLLIRLEADKVKKGIGLYTPILFMSLIIITFRIIFIPNSLINIVFPPVLLLFTIFQGWTLNRFRKSLPMSDIIFGWISFAAMLVTTIIAFRGFVLMGVQLLIWWIFQMTLIQTVIAVYDLLDIYYNRSIIRRKLNYRNDHPYLPGRTDEDLITVTWFHSLVKKALLPVAIVLSVPFSIRLASSVFDLTSIFDEYYAYPFLNVEGYIYLSFSKIVLVIVLFFAFRYFKYLSQALYRLNKINSVVKETGSSVYNENQVNFTLARNVIGIIIWGIYVIMIFYLLKIPTAAIKVIGAGLATGLGFAMKDILNNFFYGVQLMSGRLRVGDYIECDGVRGRVDSINYQSTQIISGDGSVMAFPNSSLFNKNFKNLTRNHSYELQTIEVGVKYGVDVEQVRQIIISALEPLQKKDKYGRNIVDPEFGIQVRFHSFGDNSVNLSVVQFTTVEEKFTYLAKAKELIYNALNENGIEIPFPQRDIFIKNLPSK